MREVCFCGRDGDIEDRLPMYLGDAEWGLVCPSCGHLDRLLFVSTDVRRGILAEAQRRQIQRAAPVGSLRAR